MSNTKNSNISLRYRLQQKDQYDFQFDDYIADIKCEIELLLNAQAMFNSSDSNLYHLNDSILSYGLSNNLRWQPTHYYLDGTLLPHIARLIQKREPRLHDVCVSVDEDYLHAGYRVGLRVQGNVKFHQQQSALVFKTHCDPFNMRFNLS